MVDNKKQTGSKRYLMKNDSMKSQYRINEQIRAKEVRIVGDDVEPKVYPIFQGICGRQYPGYGVTAKTEKRDRHIVTVSFLWRIRESNS